MGSGTCAFRLLPNLPLQELPGLLSHVYSAARRPHSLPLPPVSQPARFFYGGTARACPIYHWPCRARATGARMFAPGLSVRDAALTPPSPRVSSCWLVLGCPARRGALDLTGVTTTKLLLGETGRARTGRTLGPCRSGAMVVPGKRMRWIRCSVVSHSVSDAFLLSHTREDAYRRRHCCWNRVVRMRDRWLRTIAHHGRSDVLEMPLWPSA